MPGYPRKFKRYSRSYKKRKGRSSNSYASSFSNMRVGDVARSAWNGVKYLRGLVNSEMYKKDNYATAAAIPIGTAPPNAYIFTNIDQGDGDGGRSGNSILAKRLSVRGTITMNALATTTFVRCIIVRDLQNTTDSYGALSNIIQDPSNMGSLLNNQTVGRYTVLYDRTYSMNSGGKTSILLNVNLAFDYHVRWNGSAATDIQKGGLYMYLWSNESTNTPTYTAHHRLSYHDN